MNGFIREVLFFTRLARHPAPLSDALRAKLRHRGPSERKEGGADADPFPAGDRGRPFDRGGFGPRDLSSPRKDSVGGKTFWAGTAEVRFPLPFIPDDLGLSGAVFADAGSLFGANDLAKSLNTCTAEPCPEGSIILADESSIRSSVGASIMWNSPVGPIRMDFAKALTKEKFDEEQFFRFGASTKF